MKPLTDCHLYTFIDTAYLHGRDPAAVAQQLCDGGSDIIQLRAKNLAAGAQWSSAEDSTDEILRLAEKIQPILQRANVGLVINDHLNIAQKIGADICHLGQEDFFDAGFTHMSELFRSSRGNEAHSENLQSEIANPQSVKIGLSTHAPTQAQRAIDAAPAYIAIGPVFATPTKPTAKAVTLEYVRWAAANVKIPWFSIGGINLENLDEVLAAGATRICVVSAILNAPDVAKACRDFKKRLG